jgi:DUF4097 and DUF4098 domain-containing protein YvlB
MAPSRQPGRKALIVAVAVAMAGTLALMVATIRPAATVTATWPKISTPWHQQERTRTEHKDVVLGAGVHRIEIETDGKVHVIPGTAGKLRIEAKQHAFGSSPEEADEALKTADWTVTAVGADTMRITENVRSTGPQIRFNSVIFARGAHTDFEVQAPPGLQVTVRGDDGDVSVVGMAGADLKTDSGRVEAAGIRGELIIETDSGSLAVRDVQGDVQATTDSGWIRIVNASGHVRAQADSGIVRVQGADRATLRSEHGGIEVSNIAHAVQAETATGHITAENLRAGAVLTSEHGSIRGREISGGRVEAKTETGFIDLKQPRVQDADYDLQTEHGNIELALPKTAALTVGLKTEHGHIDDHLGLPQAHRDNEDGQTVKGKLGNGRHRLAITTETGSIELREAT